MISLKKLSELYHIDRRTLYNLAKAGLWGARKEKGNWVFEEPPITEETITTEAIAAALHCSSRIVRRWCEQGEKLKATKTGRRWRIHYIEGLNFISLRLGGFRKQGTKI